MKLNMMIIHLNLGYDNLNSHHWVLAFNTYQPKEDII